MIGALIIAGWAAYSAAALELLRRMARRRGD
jgi:hypothetical protein